MKILLPGAGGKVLHIRAFQEQPEVEAVLISEINPWAYGNFVADAAFRLPPFRDAGFLKAFRRLHRREGFDVVVPIHDASLHFFSERREEFEGGTLRVAINPAETIDMVSDKLATYEFFRATGTPTAKLCTFDRFRSERPFDLPVFLKPRFIEMRGTERQLYLKLEDEADVEYAARKVGACGDEYVVQEFLEGREINVDFFCDEESALKSWVAVERLAMGQSRGIRWGEIVIDKRFGPHLERIASGMRFWGANQAQAYLDEADRICFTEINGRFSGSSVFVKAAGVDYFARFLDLLHGRPIEIPEQPRSLTMSSWENPFFYDESPLRD